MGSTPTFAYDRIYHTSLQVNWRLDAVFERETTLSFEKPFLPDDLVGARHLGFLNDAEQLTLNHIRAHSYVCLVALVEEYIVPFLVEHIRARIYKATRTEISALLHFAEEESKHIELFQRFSRAFRRSFKSPCDVIGPAEIIAEQVLSLSPLGVALSILHVEWLTQLHYVASVRDATILDSCFCRLLRHHWLEEAQHTKLDTAVVELISTSLSPFDISRGIADYLLIVRLLDEGLGPQAERDLEAFTAFTGRKLAVGQKERYRTAQRQSYRKTFLTSGMRHPKFQQTLAALSSTAVATVAEHAEMLDSGRPSTFDASGDRPCGRTGQLRIQTCQPPLA
jgi:hypothetical protein